MSNNNEKWMLTETGYEIKHSIKIGEREILVAENMDNLDGKYYLKAEYTSNGILGQYDRMISSADYLTIMAEFVKSLDAQITMVRDEIHKTNYNPHPITAKQCHPHDRSQDINGKVVAIRPEALRPEYRREDQQLVLVDGGSGARGNTNGNAVFCYHLNDGSHTRFERYDVLGEMIELPEWAKARLATIQAEMEAKKAPVQQTAHSAVPQESKQNEQNTIQPSPPTIEPEIVAGYEILERVRVGNKNFVMGYNKEADSYVTWQQTDGCTGYDLGHYLSTREKAVQDLHARADRERNSQAPDKTKRNRNDAR